MGWRESGIIWLCILRWRYSCTRETDIGDEYGNDMGDMCRHEKSGVWPAQLGLGNLVSVLLRTELRVIPVKLGMEYWITHDILLSPSFSWIVPPSPLISVFPILQTTITKEHKVMFSLFISRFNDDKLTLSSAFTKYTKHWVQHTPRAAYTNISKM